MAKEKNKIKKKLISLGSWVHVDPEEDDGSGDSRGFFEGTSKGIPDVCTEGLIVARLNTYLGLLAGLLLVSVVFRESAGHFGVIFKATLPLESCLLL